MKRFCIKTFIIILPAFIIAILIEYALRNIPNDYSYKKTYMDQNSNQIETLILGGSHTYYGLDPVYFENRTFNDAYVSQSLDLDYEIFKKYSDQLLQLKTIIIPISYPSLFATLSQTPESWRMKNYVVYRDIGTLFFFDKLEVLSRKFSDNVSMIVKFYVKNESIGDCSDLGWGTSFQSDNSFDLDETGRSAAIRHSIESYPNASIFRETSKKIEAILDSFIASCELKNVHVLLITTPCYVSYRENLDNEQLKMTMDIVYNITQRHQNCAYINMLADSSFRAEDYCDADHMNEIGAKKLSLKVNEILKKMNEKQ